MKVSAVQQIIEQLQAEIRAYKIRIEGREDELIKLQADCRQFKAENAQLKKEIDKHIEMFKFSNANTKEASELILNLQQQLKAAREEAWKQARMIKMTQFIDNPDGREWLYRTLEDYLATKEPTK